jgi:hypothetical protein
VTSSTVVTRCGLCGSRTLERVLSLGSSPPTCAMVPVGQRQPEVHYPLDLLECQDCSLVQLSVIVDPAAVFPAGYPYSSGNSPQLHHDFEDLARLAAPYLREDDLVVDIGANDGTLLSKFDCRTVGVEPTGQAQRIKGPAYQEFFTEELAARIWKGHGPAKVITACNVLAHVDNLADVMCGIRVLLADDGVLIAENHDLAALVEHGQWDFVYHEHLRYYDQHSFTLLLYMYGFGTGLKSYQSIPTHGGSFRVTACKNAGGYRPPQESYDFAGLAESASDTRAAIRELASAALPGIGATARATTIINYCRLDVEEIPYVCEVPGSDKIGHYIPGTRIPVVDETVLFDEQPARTLLFSWHLADVIMPKLRARGYDGEILTPNLAAQETAR